MFHNTLAGQCKFRACSAESQTLQTRRDSAVHTHPILHVAATLELLVAYAGVENCTITCHVELLVSLSCLCMYLMVAVLLRLPCTSIMHMPCSVVHL